MQLQITETKKNQNYPIFYIFLTLTWLREELAKERKKQKQNIYC